MGANNPFGRLNENKIAELEKEMNSPPAEEVPPAPEQPVSAEEITACLSPEGKWHQPVWNTDLRVLKVFAEQSGIDYSKKPPAESPTQWLLRELAKNDLLEGEAPQPKKKIGAPDRNGEDTTQSRQGVAD